MALALLVNFTAFPLSQGLLPYVARAVSVKNLSRPDDGFADASDPATILLGNINRIYGVPGKADSKGSYRGNYGFILD